MTDPAPVVTNSGPVIILSAIGQLDLLRGLHASVLVPESVFAEVSVVGMGRPGSAELAAAAWLERVPVIPPADPLLLQLLGRGEADAITLALRRGAAWLLLDDRKARRIAEVTFGLRVRGVAGILVAAKRRALVPRVRPLLDEVLARGYFISERVVAQALRESGE
jgi:hypothetical protein